MIRRVRRLGAVTGTALLVVALASACSSGPSAGTEQSATSPTPAPSSSAVRFEGVSVQGAPDREPEVLIGDDTQATSSIQVRDVVTGTGALATASTPVTVQYLARGARTKRTFDSSWDRGSPFHYDPKAVTFSAFVDGVPGMRVGGRRIVIVPGSLAFGATPPSGSGLQPDETVVYVIDLVQVG